MKIITLIDNVTKNNKLNKEFGLSLFIDFQESKILFDTGCSRKFIENAQYLGVNISEVVIVILSHFHSDHTGGVTPFLEKNIKANIYLPPDALSRMEESSLKRYGSNQLIIEERNRFNVIEEVKEIEENVYVVGYCDITEKSQSQDTVICCQEAVLVIEEDNELIVFTGCSHHGIVSILKRIKKNFNKKIRAVIGGFHLFDLPKDSLIQESVDIASYLQENKIDKIYTGHCTGDEGYMILKEKLGDNLESLYSGLSVEI